MVRYDTGKIKEVRTALGLSQEAFAIRLGNKTKRQHVSNWEKKKSRPNIKSLLSIVNAFKLPIDIFFKFDLHHSNNLFSEENLTV